MTRSKIFARVYGPGDRRKRTTLSGSEHPDLILKYNLLAFKFLKSRMPFVLPIANSYTYVQELY